MDRKERFLRISLTLGINVVLFPAALIIGSGHFGGDLNSVVLIVLVIAASLFMLPSLIAWLLVGTWAGSVVGGIAVAAAQLGCTFWIVSHLRERWLNKRRAIDVAR